MDSEPLRTILDRLTVDRETKSGYSCHCPAHDDDSPSLSVDQNADGEVLLHCHAGCSTEAILDALGMDWSDLYPEEKSMSWDPFEEGERVDDYVYHDADGDPVLKVIRFKNADREHPAYGEKTFRQKSYRPDDEDADSDGYVWGRSVDPLLYRLPKVLEAAEAGDGVYLVEGEKDVHTLEEHGYAATCKPGGASKESPGEKWTEAMTQALEGAHVFCLPDNDEPGQAFMEAVAEKLVGRAASVKIVELPDLPHKGDVTDWLQSEDYDPYDLELLVKAADAFSLDESEEAESGASWNEIRDLYEDDESKAARVEAAEQAITSLHLATDRDSERLFAYDEEEKILKPNGEQRVRSLLVQNLGKYHSQHEQREVLGKVRPMTFRSELGNAEFIPVANGDLFLGSESVRLKNADPGRAPLSRSSAEWDPNADCDFFRGHIKGLVPSEQERETLQEYIGYTLMQWDIPFHKALFVVGPTASGKSTTLEAIAKLLGSVSLLSPQQLVNGRFGAAELEGSWANIRSDLDASLLQDVGLFKEIVAGDPIYVERKHEQGYTIRPTAKHLYAANRLPDVSIDDDAFFRRILLVSFPTTIPMEDRINRSDLDAKLETELNGILRWAVEGLQRVLSQNGFTHDLPPSETRKRWEERASSVGRFKAQMLEITGSSEDIEPKDRVFSAYTDFCQRKGLSAESKRQLTTMLTRDPRIGGAQRTPSGFAKQVRCYTGVQIDENG
jgi:putative DNA primase/helicase